MLIVLKQILDGETIREWVESPAYIYRDGSGYGHPWELLPYGNHTMRTKAGAINGYLSEFQMAVRKFNSFFMLLAVLRSHSTAPKQL